MEIEKKQWQCPLGKTHFVIEMNIIYDTCLQESLIYIKPVSIQYTVLKADRWQDNKENPVIQGYCLNAECIYHTTYSTRMIYKF